jgi:hypothetical protein
MILRMVSAMARRPAVSSSGSLILPSVADGRGAAVGRSALVDG